MSIAKIAVKHSEERMAKEADKAKKAQRASSKLVDLASASRLIRELTSGLPITPKLVRST